MGRIVQQISGHAGVASTAPALPASAGLAGFAAGYSLRWLSPDYLGPLVQVRRSSDSTVLDIGVAPGASVGFVKVGQTRTNVWQATPHLDRQTLLDFVGAGDGFITIWYDQSGNGVHLRQADPLAQPRIVIGGALVEESGQPSVDFSDPADTQAQLLVSTATLPNSSNAFVFLAHKKTLSTDNPIVFNLNHGGNIADRVSAAVPWSSGHIYWDAPAGSRTTAGEGSPAVPYYNDDAMHQYTLTRTGVGNQQRIRRDGAELARGGAAGGNLQLNQISAGYHHAGRGADMHLSEMVVYLRDMFGDMEAIEADQQAWWNTP